MKDLAVVVPLYNESEYIGLFVDEWKEALEGIDYTLFLIDDGSTDNSENCIKSLIEGNKADIQYIKKRNSGHGKTCRYGYDHVISLNNYHWLLQIDSDGQCDPNHFSDFWDSTHSADVIFGIRKRRDDGFSRVLLSKTCSFLSMLLSGVKIEDANVPYRLMKLQTLSQALEKVPVDFNIQNVALTVALKKIKGLRWKFINIHFRDRTTGTNSINIRKIIHLGIEMLSELRTMLKQQ